MDVRQLLLLVLCFVAGLFASPAVAAYSAQMACVQQQLAALGYDPGSPDGLVGGKTRSAAAAYLVAAGSVSDLPELSNDSAAQWCAALAGAHAEAAIFAAEVPDDVLIADDSVSNATRATLERGLAYAHDLLKRHVGVVLPEPVRAFAGTDAVWLTDNYLSARGLPVGYRDGKLAEFGSCEPPAESAYYVMFLCLDNQAWRRGDAESMGTVAHEYMHNMQFGMVGGPGKLCCTNSDAMSVFGPQWLVEGSAEYMKFLLWDQLGYRSLDKLIREYTGRFRNGDHGLAALETRKGFRENPASWDIAPVAAHYLVETSGLPSLAVFWTEIGKKTPMRDAFKIAFGQTTEEFDAAFAAALR